VTIASACRAVASADLAAQTILLTDPPGPPAAVCRDPTTFLARERHGFVLVEVCAFADLREARARTRRHSSVDPSPAVAERAASRGDREGIATVGDLRVTPETRLLEIAMVGPKAVADIAQALRGRSVRSVDPIEVLALPPARAISERDSGACADAPARRRRGCDRAAIRDLARACAADPGS